MIFTTLISANELQSVIGDCLVVDCRFSLADPKAGKSLYQSGHVQGAFYADLDEDLSSPITPNSGRHPLPDFNQLSQLLAGWGLNQDQQVVVYDHPKSAYAVRLWWLLRAMGHTQVAVLDGGIRAWTKAGGVLRQTLAKNHATGDFRLKLDSNAWFEVDALQQGLNNQTIQVLDARGKVRFTGEEEPFDTIAGHIPGSISFPVATTWDNKGFLLSANQLRENYLDVMNGKNSEQVVHTCGSGVFACQGVLAMEVAGLQGSKIYPGSWSEWIREPSRGIATGEH